MRRRLPTLLALATILASPGANAQTAGGRIDIPSTALLVTSFHDAYLVRGDDGKDHVEYDLLVTNAFSAPVMLTAVDITDATGKVLLRLDGDALVAATQTLLDQEPVQAVAPSAAVAVEIDLVLPPGTAPQRLSHRIAYNFPADAPLASIIGSREVAGPEVAVDPRPAMVIASPLSGPGWAALNGCCVPNIHRNTRIAAGTRMATPETFAIDWIRLDGNTFFAGDGKENAQYAYFGDEVRSVAPGEVVALHDGMAESTPFQLPTTVGMPEDYAGNYVVVRIGPDVYALYTCSRAASRSGRATGSPPARRSASSAIRATRPTRISISACSTGRISSPATACPSSSTATN